MQRAVYGLFAGVQKEHGGLPPWPFCCESHAGVYGLVWRVGKYASLDYSTLPLFKIVYEFSGLKSTPALAIFYFKKAHLINKKLPRITGYT